MAAALTIAIILAFTVGIVRIAGVAMRQTGLPEHVARFQCLSALTGTGFTTGESEAIVNYPVRRKILVGLMVVGNLGIVSIGTTFVVAFLRADEGGSTILFQFVAFSAAIGIIVVMSLSRRLDRFMCDMIGRILQRTTSFSDAGYRTLLQLDGGYSIAEHKYDQQAFDFGRLGVSNPEVSVLAIRRAADSHIVPVANAKVRPENCNGFIVFGSDETHRIIDSKLGSTSSQ